MTNSNSNISEFTTRSASLQQGDFVTMSQPVERFRTRRVARVPLPPDAPAIVRIVHIVVVDGFVDGFVEGALHALSLVLNFLEHFLFASNKVTRQNQNSFPPPYEA